jgi:hypothetical protein
MLDLYRTLMTSVNFNNLHFFFPLVVVLEFELRASCLLSRCCITLRLTFLKYLSLNTVISDWEFGLQYMNFWGGGHNSVYYRAIIIWVIWVLEHMKNLACLMLCLLCFYKTKYFSNFSNKLIFLVYIIGIIFFICIY